MDLGQLGPVVRVLKAIVIWTATWCRCAGCPRPSSSSLFQFGYTPSQQYVIQPHELSTGGTLLLNARDAQHCIRETGLSQWLVPEQKQAQQIPALARRLNGLHGTLEGRGTSSGNKCGPRCHPGVQFWGTHGPHSSAWLHRQNPQPGARRRAGQGGVWRGLNAWRWHMARLVCICCACAGALGGRRCCYEVREEKPVPEGARKGELTH